jgi:uracil-DNA glycosylase family protein
MPSAPTPPSKKDIDACRRCPLWERATQGVPGEGPRRARIMFVGEQPGDEEDLQGKPFVGPAGRLLRRAMVEAGIEADDAYVTNAVKHFSWEPRGKRRIHKTPAQREIAACHDWLDAELSAVKPAVVVTLGATALGAVMGKKMTITAARAVALTLPGGARVVATYHPSAVLRAPDDAGREELYRTLSADLKRAARAAAKD